MMQIINQQKKYWINTKRFEALLKRLIRHYKLKNPEGAVVFVDTRTITRLNRQFLKKDSPTDVLSFPIREDSPDGKFYLGDIIISVPQAFKQCFPEKHGLERELEILTVHGFLHLLGYEHAQGMEEEEEKIRNLMLEGSNGN
ncbi:MAG: rRNA maturation RNase YbeY [Candidatus Aminicenantes bacterium]